MFSPTHELDDVARFLRSWRGDASDVEPLGSGTWSQVFGFRSAGREYVLRLGNYLPDYEKDRVMSAFAGPDLPVPEIIDVGEALNGVYAISVRAYGEALDALDGATFRQTLPSILRMLDAMRVIDVSDTTGYGMWSPDGSAPFQTWREFLLDVRNDRPDMRHHGWLEQLESQPAASAMFEEGYRQLERLVEGCPEDRYLMHTDIVGDNVRVQNGRVSAVVDWANAMYGDFLYDLARLIFYQPWYPEMESVAVGQMARSHYESIGLAVPGFEQRLRAYQVHIGLDAQSYNAFTRRWDEVELAGRRTLELARGS
ncbi:MAG: aminoglycoside phosphotransferase family protein [Dehalococcoidia bacterium]|jgi:hygromycin-B 4-O-kinase|nr:aminoglycoside phosphotransferase family protein [Dehalococcoidia bacterium]